MEEIKKFLICHGWIDQTDGVYIDAKPGDKGQKGNIAIFLCDNKQVIICATDSVNCAYHQFLIRFDAVKELLADHEINFDKVMTCFNKASILDSLDKLEKLND